MKTQVLEIESESLESARKQAEAAKPADLFVLSEKVLLDGKPATEEAIADSAEEAFAIARGKVPEGAQILGEEEKISKSRDTLVVQAFSPEAAKTEVRRRIGATTRIETIQLKSPGRKGFLGVGKRPNEYQATVFRLAVVKVIYKRRAKIRVEFGERKYPETAYCLMCGRGNAPSKASGKNVHYFCSSGCDERYFKVKVGTLLFGRQTFILNASGQDISGMLESGRRAAESATAHCWSCGKTISMSAEKCSSCSREQSLQI